MLPGLLFERLILWDFRAKRVSDEGRSQLRNASDGGCMFSLLAFPGRAAGRGVRNVLLRAPCYE